MRKLETTCFETSAQLYTTCKLVLALCRVLLAESRLINQSRGSAPAPTSSATPYYKQNRFLKKKRSIFMLERS